MIKVQFDNKNNPVFKKQNLDIEHKRTFINALNTVDSEIYKKESVSDSLYRDASNLVFLPAVLLAFYKFDEKLTKFAYQKFSKNFPKILALTAITAAATWALGVLRTDSRYKANMLGISNAEKKLNNPKLFLPITDEINNEIVKSDFYQHYKNKKYKNDLNLLADYKLNKILKYVNDTKKSEADFKTEISKGTLYNDAVKQVDDDTQKYIKRTISGLNIFMIGASAAASVLTAVITALINKFKPKLKWAGSVSVLPYALLVFNMGYISHRSVFNDIEMVSKYKAKRDFLTGKKDGKEAITLAKDFLKNKNKYMKNIKKQNKLTAVRNTYLVSKDADDKQIIEAKQTQEKFFNSLKSKDYQQGIKNNQAQNGILKDFVLNASLPVGFIYMYRGINDGIRNTKIYKSVPLIKAITVCAVVAALNSMLSLSMIKNSRDK